MTIPIIIICFNNYKYVENMISQLTKPNRDLEKQIIILDNKSTCPDTIQYLKNAKNIVLYNTENMGPWISATQNTHIYNLLPDKFILTDPDLELNPLMPSNFIEQLVELSNKYNCGKIGPALSIFDFNKMYQYVFFRGKTIYEWESQFWKKKIEHGKYELYDAEIDTTLCLINKKGTEQCIRIAGNFTAKHLPWYTDNSIYNVYENYILNSQMTTISTTSQLILTYIDKEFKRIKLNNQTFFIKTSNNLTNYYLHDEIVYFLDRYICLDKIFIDIGTHIGLSTLYACRKSNHVYAINTQTQFAEEVEYNCKNNCRNFTIMMNKDIVQLLDCINLNTVSAIKVDIHGEEEHILDYLYNIYTTYKIPMHIMCYSKNWNSKTLNDFVFLSEDHKKTMTDKEVISLLFQS